MACCSDRGEYFVISLVYQKNLYSSSSSKFSGSCLILSLLDFCCLEQKMALWPWPHFEKWKYKEQSWLNCLAFPVTWLTWKQNHIRCFVLSSSSYALFPLASWFTISFPLVAFHRLSHVDLFLVSFRRSYAGVGTMQRDSWFLRQGQLYYLRVNYNRELSLKSGFWYLSTGELSDRWSVRTKAQWA